MHCLKQKKKVIVNCTKAHAYLLQFKGDDDLSFFLFSFFFYTNLAVFSSSSQWFLFSHVWGWYQREKSAKQTMLLTHTWNTVIWWYQTIENIQHLEPYLLLHTIKKFTVFIKTRCIIQCTETFNISILCERKLAWSMQIYIKTSFKFLCPIRFNFKHINITSTFLHNFSKLKAAMSNKQK